ncbi:alpha/beta fold hydrolase [Actinocorallia aurantiaca]|uniref:Alpha/beta fold hydrolase n=1 Tax=Actinocorallia aurantiaca TaxID=46204 RepID=A0ABP6GUS4_9ACTN
MAVTTGGKTEVPDLWISRFGPSGGARTRLVCFPHAGGSSSFFFPLARALAPDVEVVAVQYPGRQNRRSEPLLTRITDLVDGVLPELDRAGDLPWALFGHSMGAVVAFEAARRAARPPLRLFASGRRAPSRIRDEDVHTRDDAGLIAELRRLGGTDPRVFDEPELLAGLLPAFRADYRAIETYRPDPGAAVGCPVTVLIGVEDPQVTEDEARSWRHHTTDRTDLHVFPGGHFYLADHQRRVTALIAAGLGDLSAKE